MGTKRVYETKVINNEGGILRIFGPTKDRDSEWKTETDDELNNLIINKNKIN